FGRLTRRVRVLFFTQTIDCETCPQVRQILNELPLLSDKISVEEVNLVLDRERAARFGLDRVPALALEYQEPDNGPDWHDSRIRFLGTPSGYEFISLLHAFQLAGGLPRQLSSSSQARLAAIDTPTRVQVFTTPTCPHCPRAVNLAYEMAVANEHIQ